MKFHVHSFYTLGEMALAKKKYENEQRAITKKKKCRLPVLVHCTSS
jgi:hypothetical protein